MRREFWDIDTDEGQYEHFRHWRDWFPPLGRVHPTTFVRQAANLWVVKAQLRQQLLGQVGRSSRPLRLDHNASTGLRSGA
jgi:hypothetical protein